MDQLPLLMLAQADDVPPPQVPDAPALDGGAGPAPEGTPLQQAPGGAPGGAPAPNPGGGMDILWLILPIFAIMLIFTLTSSRKEKKKRQAVVENLRKGAKVRTVGGILGTVVEVREDEVVVKVDENANTRLRFSKAAIQDVTTDDKKDEKSK